ncbi:glycosyltransferase family 2 protein [Riemerella anatipestifer]|uniref:glycosyltransferase family 2 protein n=1 Tax=Riemerella anatipestifer TaxID=34085 RepID=UPI0030C5E736
MNYTNKSMVSIIIPVYNTEKYLEKCINSIVEQTYTNWELLLINDGSQDDSLSICEKYANEYSNIYVFSQENKGPSAARNIGIDNAHGQYICFVDSDDWVDDNYLEIFIGNMSENEDMMVVQDHKRIINDKIIRYTNGYNNEIFELPKDLSSLIKEYKFIQGYSVNKLYIREILENHSLRFSEEIDMGEDEVFFYKYLQLIDKIIFVKPDPYNYVGRIGSLTSRHSKFISEFLRCAENNKFYHYILKNENSAENRSFFKGNFSQRFNHLLRTIIYWEGKYSKKERIFLLNKMHKEYSNSLQYLEGDTALKKIDYLLFKLKLFGLLDFILKLKTRLN